MKETKEHNDIKYKVFSARLSDKNIKELQNRLIYFKSWNLLFDELLKKQKQNA